MEGGALSSACAPVAVLPHPTLPPAMGVCTGNTLNTHWTTVESIEDPLVNQNINSFVLHKWPIEASNRNV